MCVCNDVWNYEHMHLHSKAQVLIKHDASTVPTKFARHEVCCEQKLQMNTVLSTDVALLERQGHGASFQAQ